NVGVMRRKTGLLTPFLVTACSSILVVIIFWCADNIPTSTHKCDEVIALAAIVYVILHCVRTLLLSRRLMLEDI
ncbi:hypothetical protein PFISCL1PPCAC_12781, partial [Pristionchus fissidentatus]